jgi:hypothetical protein
MAEPVLVVHGVANRDRTAFETRVSQLNEKVGEAWAFLPVFWGDLGADADAGMFAALPNLDDEARVGVRALGDQPDPAWPQLVKAGLGEEDGVGVRSDEAHRQAQEEFILRGAASRIGAVGATVRSSVRAGEAHEAIREVLQQDLPTTRHLHYVDDPAVLEAVGRVLGDAATAAADQSGAHMGAEVRGSPLDEAVGPYGQLGGGEATRGPVDIVKRKVSDTLRDLDDLVGRSVGGALGRVNQLARRVVIEGVVRFFGDVFVYSRHRTEIHNRFWQAIEAWPEPGYGTEQRPINVIAHSLGGVAVFDAALSRRRPLWIKSLVTFGSQPAFFHTVDRREELAEFAQGHPVALPPTIERWTNLWEPMDLVAFTAGVVFRFEPDGRPNDFRIATPATEIWDARGWTHSAYWDSDELVDALRGALVP